MDHYPNWVPLQIVERVQEYEEIIRTGDKWPSFDCEYNIWRRLATRPEMESVWNFITGTVGSESLLTNGGLSGKVNRAIRYFFSSPRLSPADYKKEMLEIAKLANTLSKKIKKFCDAGPYNPFEYAMVFTNEQLKISLERLGEKYDDNRGRSWNGYYLDSCMPTFDYQIKGIANRAQIESLEQTHKLRLPRKVKDENLFRTYFIKVIGDYFFVSCADYSPARLATFCSVALDDIDISPDLARKLYELDDECRAMIEAQRAYLKQED